MTVTIGDCLDTLRGMPDASVDAVVTDPPYGLGKEPDPRDVLRAWLDGEAYQPGGAGFMGKAWDAFVPSPCVWSECLRVLKPGGHLLAFAGSRTYDWIVLGVRLAGFEVRDQLLWLYGSGFPKSHNVSKAIDRAAGAEREVVGKAQSWNRPESTDGHTARMNTSPGVYDITAPATEAARQWNGWGTALKPAHEPIVLARKPLVGTVAHNVTTHGTGAINVDGCRVGDDSGRWPANVMHDGSPEVVAGFPVTGKSTGGRIGSAGGGALDYAFGSHFTKGDPGYGDTGTAARFFYSAKASRAERERGLTHTKGERRNVHPTVKNVAVMRWLVRLVTPPAGVVLDPFTGSGTTGIACALEGFDFVGCELSPEYAEIARARIAHAAARPHEWEPDADAPDEPNEDQLDMFK